LYHNEFVCREVAGVDSNQTFYVKFCYKKVFDVSCRDLFRNLLSRPRNGTGNFSTDTLRSCWGPNRTPDASYWWL